MYTDIQSLIKERSWKAGIGMSALDSEANYIGERPIDWVVGLSRTRDSDVLDNCNFDVLLESLGGEADGIVQVVRIGHWACGWVEQIHVHSTAKEQLEILRTSLNALADYPVLDDSAFSEAEYEEQCERFDNYRSNFLENLCKYLGTESDLDKRYGRRNVDAVLSTVFSEDVGYCGLNDAYVNEDSIARFCRDSVYSGISDLVKQGNKLAIRLKTAR